MPIERRDFLTVAGTVVAGLAVAPSVAAAENTSPPTSRYEIAPLAFDPQKVKGFSEKMLRSHYDNNYSGAVKRLNAITEQLTALNFDTAPGFTVNGLKREELIAANSMILHEIYFSQLGEANDPGKALGEAIARDFGSFNQWRTEFVAMGKAEGGGSGWVVMSYSPHDKRLRNVWAADHTTMLAGGDPILVMDMYEHAYQMDFGAKAGDYVTAFMGALNWKSADQRYQQRRV